MALKIDQGDWRRHSNSVVYISGVTTAPADPATQGGGLRGSGALVPTPNFFTT